MKRNHRLTLDTLFGLIAAATTVTSFAAVTVAKEGKYENVGCYTSTMQTNAPVKGQMGGSYDGLGTTITKEGDIFNNTSGRCLGTFTLVGEEYNEDLSALKPFDTAGQDLPTVGEAIAPPRPARELR